MQSVPAVNHLVTPARLSAESAIYICLIPSHLLDARASRTSRTQPVQVYIYREFLNYALREVSLTTSGQYPPIMSGNILPLQLEPGAFHIDHRLFDFLESNRNGILHLLRPDNPNPPAAADLASGLYTLKIAVEAILKVAEKEKLDAEGKKIQEEVDKIKAETKKIQAETEKIKAQKR